MSQTTQLRPNSKSSNRNDGRILVVASPLQGHAAPLLKLSHQITSLGTKVTFLTTDFARTRLIESSNGWDDEIRMISVPDGLELEDDRKDIRILYFSLLKVLPGYLEDLLKETNRSIKNYSDRISGVIVDASLTLLLGIPKKMGIKNAVFWCSTPGCLALGLMTPRLIEDKIIDADGTPLKDASIELLQNLPAMTQSELTWYFPGDINTQKEMFNVIKGIIDHLKDADWVLCNWFHELEPSGLVPRLYPVGPLLAKGLSAGSFCPEDSTCINWLDKQPENSVVYAAFGSTARFTQQQFDELANGLELMGRPFLWVAWSGLSDGVSRPYSNEFKERVGERGKIVEWAPQEAVLNHPSTACFITHCGWSSFLESLSAGVPMLCWPYFGDQMYTQSCICDGWRVGMRLTPDEGTGIIRGDEIVQKVDQLLCDEIIKKNAVKWREMANKSTSEGGLSVMNLEYVLQHMR